jgi:hypothetical protein
MMLALAAACGGANDGGDGGDDDSSNAGAGDQSGSGGSGDSSGTGGSDTGGTDGGGSGGASTGGKGGTTGKGGSGGSATGATGPALDRIEAACEVDCDAQYALECAPANGNTLTCKSQCAAQTAQLGDFCLAEYAELVECRGEGGYECVTTYPYPRSTCAATQAAFQSCMMDLGCKRSCKKSVDESCTSMTLDACIDACIAEGDELPSGCIYSWDSIAACKVTGSAACVDGELQVPAACASSVMYVAECIQDESMDMCEAWCWAANTLGCGGTDCAADCAAKLTDTTCGTEWSEVLDCALFFNDAACDGDTFMANGICDSDVTAYETCVAGGTGM